jgi:antitoxin component YwqK of YwqJK toxin-antitoxin module
MRPTRAFVLNSVLLLLLATSTSWAQAVPVGQDTINRIDELGRKQGYWRIQAPLADKPDYADGQVVEEGRYTNSKRTGVWRRYWPNGQVMSEITYQMGRPKGNYVTYYPNGKTEEQGTWDLDRNTGAFRRWHPNGKLAQDFVFNEYGVRDGEQKYYHENGQLAVSVHVREGREEGTMKRWTPDGKLLQVAEFDNGVIDPANSRFIQPAPKAEEVKADPKAEPAPPVTTEETTNAVLFRENGYNTLYDKQLRISQQGEFRDGRLYDGRRYDYDKDGLLVRIRVFKGGRYVGDAVIEEEDKR